MEATAIIEIVEVTKATATCSGGDGDEMGVAGEGRLIGSRGRAKSHERLRL